MLSSLGHRTHLSEGYLIKQHGLHQQVELLVHRDRGLQADQNFVELVWRNVFVSQDEVCVCSYRPLVFLLQVALQTFKEKLLFQ